MSTEKMREEFNHWYDNGRKKAAPFSTVNIRDKCFEAWIASRAAIEVELPEGLTLNEMRYGSKPKPDHERLLPRTTCVKAIESIGLKIKQ